MEGWMVGILIVGFIIAVIVNIAYFATKKKSNITTGETGRYDVPKKYHYKPSKNDDDSGELYGTDGRRIK